MRFDKSGFFLIREMESLTFVRCGLFKSNGSTDQLHVDVWYRGKNLLMDCGTYQYNTTPELRKFFAGTESHNTVMLDDKDQMLKGPRFMWFYPPKVRSFIIEETHDNYVMKGEVECFGYLGDNISIERTVEKRKNDPVWVVSDKVNNKPDGMTMRQLWHTTMADCLVFDSTGEKKNAVKWNSSYYGTMEECEQIEFQTKKNTIVTTIRIKE